MFLSPRAALRWLELGRPVTVEECPLFWQDRGWLDVTDRDFVRLSDRADLEAMWKSATEAEAAVDAPEETDAPRPGIVRRLREAPPYRPFGALLVAALKKIP